MGQTYQMEKVGLNLIPTHPRLRLRPRRFVWASVPYHHLLTIQIDHNLLGLILWSRSRLIRLLQLKVPLVHYTQFPSTPYMGQTAYTNLIWTQRPIDPTFLLGVLGFHPLMCRLWWVEAGQTPACSWVHSSSLLLSFDQFTFDSRIHP